MPSPQLTEEQFRACYLSQFQNPAFDAVRNEIERITAVAWDGYSGYRKSPHVRKADPGYARPDYELSTDWIAAADAVRAARQQHDDPSSPSRFLLVNCSSRSEHTCPGEMSKSWQLVTLARNVLEAHAGTQVEILDLSRPASEYGRRIHPCKACFSTAAPLCHWPCSCYPNHAMGQVQDWMNDIYPMHLSPAGRLAELDRYIGYWKPYATSHDDLDADDAIQEEVRNAARTLLEGVLAQRASRRADASSELQSPRQK